MPGMDGYEATTELRERKGPDRHLPVIAMTADAMAENRDRCLAAGMDELVTKPVSQGALAKALDRWTPPTAPNHPGLAGHADQQADADSPSTAQSIRARLAELYGSEPEDRQALTRVATLFITREQTEIEELAAAIGRQDPAAIQQHAHRLKGAAASIGATHMANLCEQLETLGREHRAEPATELLSRLHLEFNQVRDALNVIAAPDPTA
jgi:CheY-like chemotaxis protein